MRTSRISRTPCDGHEASIEALARWTRTTLTECAAGLAFARTASNDTRPELLVWFCAGDRRYESQVVEYIARRVILWAARAKVALDERILCTAVADAMDIARSADAALNCDLQARALGVRASTYRDIRNAAENYLLRGIRAASQNYLRAMYGREVLPTEERNGNRGGLHHVRPSGNGERPATHRRKVGRARLAAAA